MGKAKSLRDRSQQTPDFRYRLEFPGLTLSSLPGFSQKSWVNQPRVMPRNRGKKTQECVSPVSFENTFINIFSLAQKSNKIRNADLKVTGQGFA